MTLEVTNIQRMQLLDRCELMAKYAAFNLIMLHDGVHEASPLRLAGAKLLLQVLEQCLCRVSLPCALQVVNMRRENHFEVLEDMPKILLTKLLILFCGCRLLLLQPLLYAESRSSIACTGLLVRLRLCQELSHKPRGKDLVQTLPPSSRRVIETIDRLQHLEHLLLGVEVLKSRQLPEKFYLVFGNLKL